MEKQSYSYQWFSRYFTFLILSLLWVWFNYPSAENSAIETPKYVFGARIFFSQFAIVAILFKLVGEVLMEIIPSYSEKKEINILLPLSFIASLIFSIWYLIKAIESNVFIPFQDEDFGSEKGYAIVKASFIPALKNFFWYSIIPILIFYFPTWILSKIKDNQSNTKE